MQRQAGQVSTAQSQSLSLVSRLVVVMTLAGMLLLPNAHPPHVAAATRPYNTALLLSADLGASPTGMVTDGAVVVWIDARGAIFTRTLADGHETLVLDGPAKRSQVALSKGIVVWTEHATDGVAIRGLRLRDGTPFTVAEGVGDRNSPAISGNAVVWRDARAGNWQIYGYDLETHREFAIAGGAGARGAVAINGPLVVWEEYRNNHWGLAAYDLAAKQDRVLTNGPDDDTAPAVSSDALIFVRRHVGQSTGALIVRELRTGQERTVTEGHLILHPALAGNLIVWEDWRDGVPSIYAFDRATGKEFPLARTEDARAPVIGGTVVVWQNRGQFSSRVTAVRLVKSLPSDPQDPPTVTDPDVRYFTETKHSVSGAFRQFWFLNGGLAVFGYPLTEAFEETDASGVKRQVQYFERAKFEAATNDPKKISLSRLGADLTAGRTFPTVASFETTDDRAYFAQTGHALGGGFLTYWQAGGGVNLFGFPISEEFQENGRTVQYFERARFEYHPEVSDPNTRVSLGQLGREALVKLGWIAPDQLAPSPASSPSSRP